MRVKPNRRELWLLLFFFCFLALFGILGVMQAVWLSATPNFPKERAVFDVEVWMSVTLLSITAVGIFSVALYRGTKGKR